MHTYSAILKGSNVGQMNKGEVKRFFKDELDIVTISVMNQNMIMFTFLVDPKIKFNYSFLDKYNTSVFKIKPAYHPKSTIFVKTDDVLYQDLFDAVCVPGAKNPHITYIMNISNDKNYSSVFWTIFVKSGDIEKFLELANNVPFIEEAVPYALANKKFKVNKKVPSVLLDQNDVPDSAKSPDIARIGVLNGKVRIQFKTFDDLFKFFPNRKDPKINFGIPFDAFYNKGKKEAVAKHIDCDVQQIIEDNMFYRPDSTVVPPDYGKIGELGRLLDSIHIVSELKDNLIKEANNDPDLDVVVIDEKYIDKLIFNLYGEQYGVDILRDLFDSYSNDYEKACTDFINSF
jgi:hypothetical protein